MTLRRQYWHYADSNDITPTVMILHRQYRYYTDSTDVTPTYSLSINIFYAQVWLFIYDIFNDAGKVASSRRIIN